MAIPKHIIAGTDFTLPADAAVAFAADLSSSLNAELTIVHCYEARHPYPIPLPPEFGLKLRAQLDERYANVRA